MSQYLMSKPSDPAEQTRLDLQHRIWLLTLNDHLHTIALPHHDKVRSILDIGTGTGSWAIAMSAAYPAARITATDLTLPSLPSKPANLNLLNSSADGPSPWPLPHNSFTLIHARMLASGIRDWPLLLRRCFHHLHPGGWLELLDLCHPFHAGDPEADKPEASPFIRWGYMAEEAWRARGLDYRACAKHGGRLAELGFVEVKERKLRWPLGVWAALAETGLEAEPETETAEDAEERVREIGELMLQNFVKFLETAGSQILAQHPSLDSSEAEKLGQEALKDLRENCCRKRFWLDVRIFSAQKPE